MRTAWSVVRPEPAFDRQMLQHPFYDRQVPIVLGDHVTLEAGTGAVHTAPGHGMDDFVVGQRYGLPVDNPVAGNGCFVPGTPLFEGEHVFKANPHVIEVLEEHGALIRSAKFTHSYPVCWRHKTPIIFRATPQWFISMQQNGLRDTAMAEIQKVALDPRLGPGAYRGHGREPAGLVYLAAAHLGRADHLLRTQGERRTASGYRRA